MTQALSTPRIILSGTASGCGKSLICLSLALALRKRNLSVSCCINGPSLAQGVIYQRICRRYVRCFDNRLLTEGELLLSMQRASVGADIMLIDGREGLYDGSSPGTLRGSDAEIASTTRTPVLLVVDVSGLGPSVAAIVRGYKGAVVGCEVGGVLTNRVEVGEHLQIRDRVFYDCSLEAFGYEPALGAFPDLPEVIDIPHGQVTQLKNSTILPRQLFIDLTHLAESHIDLDKIVGLATTAPHIRLEGMDFTPMSRRCRIAVSEDLCFNLCFQDNLDFLKFYGAEVVPFSPLADLALPKRIGAVYFTGAYLSEYGSDLSANSSMLESIRAFVSSGGVIYSEGGGTAYLSRSFGDEHERFEGVGIINGDALYTHCAPTYIESVLAEDSILGEGGLTVRGMDTGEWQLYPHDSSMVHLLKIANGVQGEREEGFSPGPQILSTFSFSHFGSNPTMAKNLVDAAEVVCRIS